VVKLVLLFTLTLGAGACGGSSAEPVTPVPIAPARAVIFDADPKTTRPKLADPPPNTLVDPRDDARYALVKLEGRRWTAENMRFETKDSYCYANDAKNCARYGRLYTWDAAMTACPPGWHVPSEEEWNDAVTAAGGDAKKLHDGGVLGFGIKKAGYRKYTGEFMDLGSNFYFWSSTEFDENPKRARLRWNLIEEDLQIATDTKEQGYSVRCIEDALSRHR
jgi:uncharacterized protein (TIGR02145 family)